MRSLDSHSRFRSWLGCLSGIACLLFGLPLSWSQDSNDRTAKSESTQSESMELIPGSMKVAAKAVRASTVTIRVDRVPTLRYVSGLRSPQKGELGRMENAKSVAVFSGVLVKQGYVVAPLFLPNAQKPEVRITLPDGEQTIGRPRILDEYSGLAIISIKDLTIPSLKCCETSEPIVGDWVVSGAAWGRQEALISLGMISGIGYRLPSSKIDPPPMIVCDLRAAQTSKGSGVVSAGGKLIGVVMAVSNDQKWTYVVPSSHVHRLLRSLALHEKKPSAKPDDILVLKRQVPRMGWRVVNVVGNEELRQYNVVVESVVKNGSADQSGLKKGDQIKSVNGKVVRTCYDVARDLLARQPGDKITIGIIRDDRSVNLPVVLGGGYAASVDNIFHLKDYIKPAIDFDSRSRGNQLVNYSIQNLSPAPCFDSDAVQSLKELLEEEKVRNQKLKSRINDLESKVDRLIEKIDRNPD